MVGCDADPLLCGLGLLFAKQEDERGRGEKQGQDDDNAEPGK